jgi:hypothetical protein
MAALITLVAPAGAADITKAVPCICDLFLWMAVADSGHNMHSVAAHPQNILDVVMLFFFPFPFLFRWSTFNRLFFVSPSKVHGVNYGAMSGRKENRSLDIPRSVVFNVYIPS